ncbi:MAG: hypothetical protein NPIRA02_37360 [Nitrospirales bacterium]|nr:MAG: hypothetical protein NPIRA02_37360 [Nitrospirales bacterium]
MRNLLVEKTTQAPDTSYMGIQPIENSARLLGLAQGLDRKQRYEKMVESVYGEPDAANRLLLKTLCLSAIDESHVDYTEN